MASQTGSFNQRSDGEGIVSNGVVEHQTIQQCRAFDSDKLRDPTANIVADECAIVPANRLEQHPDQPCLYCDAEIGVVGLGGLPISEEIDRRHLAAPLYEQGHGVTP